MRYVKIFTARGDAEVGALDDQINRWLEEKSGIEVIEVTQSESCVQDNYNTIRYVTISVWYVPF